jgi:2-methylfumaryl-CoA isomerase
MNKVLKGMRVVESSAFVAVPLAGMTLAQMGAEVIRVDRFEGGLDARRLPTAPSGASLFWAGLNKGKKSIAVDFRKPEARELISELITAPGRDAGLFMTNLEVPGWTDYKTLSQRRPDLIMTTLKGDRHGHPQVDYTVNPALGIPDLTGPEGYDGPVASALPAWDLSAGHMMVSALLAAERHRLRVGAGQEVVMSLKDIAAATIGHLGLIGEATLTNEDRGKAGNALYGAYGQDFVCACGRRVMVIGLTEGQWKGLVAATGSAAEMQALAHRSGRDLMDEAARWELRHQITAILAPWFAARRIEEFSDDFNARKLTWSIFRTVREAVRQDPDLSEANPMFTMLEQPGLGTFAVPGHPAEFGSHGRTKPIRAPQLGEHTEEILADVMRLGDGQIGALFDKGLVCGPAGEPGPHMASRDAA